MYCEFTNVWCPGVTSAFPECAILAWKAWVKDSRLGTIRRSNPNMPPSLRQSAARHASRNREALRGLARQNVIDGLQVGQNGFDLGCFFGV